MKKQTENTFTEGLVQDLHPLTTPNNVLTDALNATLITMNGNEFVLQNDMGNGRVESAYLPSGYVPVGIKEYGGVIYVASYNPLTNKGQIGSFPSPERNIDQTELGDDATKIAIVDKLFKNDNGEYTTFITKLKLFGGKILHSGDKFTLYFEDGDIENLKSLLSNYSNLSDGLAYSPKNNILSIQIAVLDKNNNLRDITPQLKRFNGHEIINFDIDTLEVIKFNTGYFIQDKAGQQWPDLSVDTERNKLPVNTYNNKLVGQLYLIVRINIIDHIDVTFSGTFVDDNNKLKLTFTTDYYYNCPDGGKSLDLQEHPTDGNAESQIWEYIDSSATNTIQGYKHINATKSQKNYIRGYELELNNQYYNCPFSITTQQPIYDEATNLYKVSNSGDLTLNNLNLDTLLNYTIVPCMTFVRLNN